MKIDGRSYRLTCQVARKNKFISHSFQWLFLFDTKPSIMRLILFLAIFTALMGSFSFSSCKSSPQPFCDTACNGDTIRFKSSHPANPFVSIGMKDCNPDTITWSHDWLDAKRKLVFSDLTGKDVKINQTHMRYYIHDTSYVWLTFNDCITGQGFMVKLPFNKTSNISRKNSALNSIDPKFHVDEGLVAYTDRGNIFVEDMATGQQATFTFGRKIETMDYTDIHQTIDTIHITREKAWAKIKMDNEWTEVSKSLDLK